MTKQTSSTANSKRPRLVRPKIKTLSPKEIEQIGKIQGLIDGLEALGQRVSELEIDRNNRFCC